MGTEMIDLADGVHGRIRPVERRVLIIMGMYGLVLLAFGGWIANTLVDVLPQALTVRSRGTAFGGMATVGAHIIRLSGMALLGGAAAGFRLGHLPWTETSDGPATERAAMLRRLVIFGAPFLGYLYLASPHNSFPTNSRIHWVDFTSWDSDNFFYAAGHLPHMIFYRHPALWQALNAGLLALTMDLLLRRIGIQRKAALISTLVFMSSTTLLLFADTAEDVMLNFLLLALVMLSMTTRSNALRGLTLAAAVLGRPNFLALAGAYIGAWAAAEIAVWAHHRRSGDARYRPAVRSLSAVAWAAGFIAVSQLVMTLLGDRYLFTNGKVLYLGRLADLAPLDTDSYFITPFSGAYLGRLLWLIPLVFPIGVVLGAVLWLTDLRRHGNEERSHVDRQRGEVVLFGAAAIVVLLFVHEAKPLLYFNVRYFSYLFPFLFVGAIAGARLLHGRSRPIAIALLTSVLLGSYVLPVNPIAMRSHNAQRAEVFLYPMMDRLQALAEDRTVYVTYGGQTVLNAVSYVLNMYVSDIQKVEVETLTSILDSPQRASVLAITRCAKLPPLDSSDIVARTHGLCVVAPSAPTPSP